MTSAHIDCRLAPLESRVADIEDSHGDTLYGLSRDVRGLKIFTRRLAAQTSTIGAGIALMTARMGLPPIQLIDVEMPTEAEIDALFEGRATYVCPASRSSGPKASGSRVRSGTGPVLWSTRRSAPPCS